MIADLGHDRRETVEGVRFTNIVQKHPRVICVIKSRIVNFVDFMLKAKEINIGDETVY